MKAKNTLRFIKRPPRKHFGGEPYIRTRKDGGKDIVFWDYNNMLYWVFGSYEHLKLREFFQFNEVFCALTEKIRYRLSEEELNLFNTYKRKVLEADDEAEEYAKIRGRNTP